MHCTTELVYGKLPAVRLRAPDGAEATITLYGAHVVSWIDASGREQLFMSRQSALDGSKALRGGVPVIFPQFAEQGSGIRHGFARISHWRVLGDGLEDGAAFVDLVLTPDDLDAKARASWPHAAQLRLRVAVRARELHLSLHVTNCGADAFSFASALHSYHRVSALADVRIGGLQGLAYAESGAAPRLQEDAILSLPEKTDRIYQEVAAPITLRDADGTRELTHQGFHNAVVWNPGAADCAALADMADDEYTAFVCIEPALIGGHLLPPGASWHGSHTIRAA
ncbi:D-hexose-6-phosphate mutarotase [Massilia sp. TS11]|uniref:D-hexose-6-phosphate mutarotase n=1 Tax=Massilia sp. TS11 TaxID=2908003 RepID=UPI001EDBA547|nr:D-hexose-6-phosphate mutarotase [Massilia sp. TS11]MCG2583529.1 D-hexose-6-phosphate mutarotase [Massilia sp. TS11]